MTYAPATRRQAKRLGIQLPTEDYVFEDEGWTSEGQDSLFEGMCKLDRRNDGRWTVSLPRRGKTRGYRQAATLPSLEEAVELARFLRNRKNRQAFRGTAPKEPTAKAATAPKEPTLDPTALLKAELAKVNSGAVRVTG